MYDDNRMNNDPNEGGFDVPETNELSEPASSSGENTDKGSAYSYGDAYNDSGPKKTGTGPNYTYYDMNRTSARGGYDSFTQDPDSGGYSRKPKKKTGFGKRLVAGIVIAALIGGVAGGAFYGMNYIGNTFVYDTSSNAADSSEQTSDSSAFEQNIQSAINSGENTLSTTSSAASDNMTVADVTALCLPSVVTIAALSQQELSSIFGGSQTYEAESAGTGVIIGENETELLIVTNNHVVNEATSLSVGFSDESTVEAQIKGQDSSNDLAVVSVKLEDISDETISQISIATLGNSDEMALGEQVVAIGNALGEGQSVTSGYVSAKDKSLTLTDGVNTFESTGLIQIDAAINSGNSGGGLFNMKGELVGINEAKRFYSSSGTTVEGMGYAIGISKAQPILEELMTLEPREKVAEGEEGYLGITCADVSSDLSSMYNIPIGVYIREVISGGPAQSAGLRATDVITAVEGYSVSNTTSLQEELKYYAAGETVEVTIQRLNDGIYAEETISVKLGDSSAIEGYENSEDDDSESRDVYDDDVWEDSEGGFRYQIGH